MGLISWQVDWLRRPGRSLNVKINVWLMFLKTLDTYASLSYNEIGRSNAFCVFVSLLRNHNSNLCYCQWLARASRAFYTCSNFPELKQSKQSTYIRCLWLNLSWWYSSLKWMHTELFPALNPFSLFSYGFSVAIRTYSEFLS